MRQLILAPQAMRHSERAQRVAVVAHRRLILVWDHDEHFMRVVASVRLGRRLFLSERG